MEVDSYTDIDVGVDLITAAIRHIRFLQTVNKYPALYGGPVLQEALRRYRDLWLPLAADYSSQVLSAPLDIEWVWHCHMLAPQAYQRDCLNNYQTIVDHQILDEEAYKQSVNFTEIYWKQKYPDQPFHIDLSGSDLEGEGQGQDLGSQIYELSYDILAAAGRQKVFYYQVSLPHYIDKKFLDRALQRYKKYMFLKKQNPTVFLVPCYDMDLLWHSHMNFPLSYKTVTELLLGTMLNHDDSVNDRSPGSRLNTSDAVTRHLWKTTFNEHFSAYGAMYRGNPPTGKLGNISETDMFGLVSKSVEIKFNKVELQGYRKESLGKFKLQIVEKSEMLLPGRYHGEKEIVDMSEKVVALKGPEFVWNNAGSVTKYVHCLDSDNLYVVLTRQTSFLCCTNGSEREGEGHIELNPLIEKVCKVGQHVTQELKVDIDSDLGVSLDVTLTLKKLSTCDLWLVPAEYEDCVMPEESEQLWGPIPLPRLPPGIENNCSVASHKLKSYKGRTEFTCRIVHSLPLMMSSVQVFFHDRMAAVAHVIGCDQIPKPNDVEEQDKSVTLEPKRGERAMVIKNSSGDWGILVGRWDGYKVGIPAKRATPTTSGRPGRRGQPGYLTLLLYKVKTKKWELLSLADPYATEEFRFDFGDAKVDMKLGKISIYGARNEIAEHLALTFCVSLLHVFLQPRPANWEPGQSLEPEISRRGASAVKYIKAEKLALVVAAGLLIATPSNHFIRKKIKEDKTMFGRGGFIHDHNHEGHDNDGGHNSERHESEAGGIFGDRGQDEGTRPEDIVTSLFGEEQDNPENGGNTVFDDLFGTEESQDTGVDLDQGHFDGEDTFGMNDSYDMFSAEYGNEMFGEEVLGEDFNTFIGDYDLGSDLKADNDGNAGDSGWNFGYDDGDTAGCGGCGAGCGGGGIFGVGEGTGGGDSGGGGGAFSGGAFSGGAFDSGDGGGDSGGGGGWLEGFSSMDTGGGGDFGGGGGDFGGGGGDGGGGDGGGCGGCGG